MGMIKYDNLSFYLLIENLSDFFLLLNFICIDYITTGVKLYYS
jgi:hypothetical protein